MDEFLFYQSHKKELPNTIKAPSAHCTNSTKCSFLTSETPETDAMNFTMKSNTMELFSTPKNTFKKTVNDQFFDTQFPPS